MAKTARGILGYVSALLFALVTFVFAKMMFVTMEVTLNHPADDHTLNVLAVGVAASLFIAILMRDWRSQIKR
jgi:hypothetical protein